MCGAQTHEHVASRDDAATALDEDLVGVRSTGKSLPTATSIWRSLSRFWRRAGNLDAADVVLLRVMAAGFADEHAVSVFKRGKRGGAAGHFDDVGLGVGHLDREGGERNVLRRLCGDVHDDLGVRHDELGRVAELGDAFGHAVLLYDEALGMSVEKLADSCTCGRIRRPLGALCRSA
mgnify:CR=1 FL=1